MQRVELVKVGAKSVTGALSVPVDLLATTPEGNFGSRAAARSISDTWMEEGPDDAWRTAVYQRARALADHFSITRIVAVGCGDGTTLASSFPHDRYTVTGIGFPKTLNGANVRHPEYEWLTLNLGAKQHLERTFTRFDADGPVLFILADILGRLRDPRNLLHAVRGILLSHPGSRLIVSSPDRHLAYGAGYDGMPKDQRRLREWTLDELSVFLASCGFTVERVDHTAASTAEDSPSQCYLELSCEAADYDRFLLASGMSHPNTAYCAVVTSEHATLATTGGIGTYTAYLARLDPVNIITIYVGEYGDSSLKAMTSSGWIHPQLFFPADAVNSWDSMERAWKTSEHLLFFFHHIKVLEYQDYRGLGARIAQAKESGLISDSVVVQVMCHGGQLHTEIANQAWQGKYTAEFWIAERVSLERADRIVIPTDYLHKHFLSVGYELGSKVVMQRLPYWYGDHSPFAEEPLGRIDTLVFFGKLVPLKGVHHFIEAVQQLEREGRLVGVKELMIVGARFKPVADDIEQPLQALSKRFKVTYLSGKRETVLQALSARRTHSLAVLPYLGDNHPYAVLEMVDLGIPFISYRAGGIPTVIPTEYHPYVLSEPTPGPLAQSIERALRMEPSAREQLYSGLRESCVAVQRQINADCLRLRSEVLSDRPGPSGAADSIELDLEKLGALATITIPVYNTELSFIEELCFGLNAQSVQPKEILFIDDGSKEDYVRALRDTLGATLRAPWRIVSQPNRGLAAARNTGLRECQTRYMITIDSDDVPATDFVFNLVQHLERNPNHWVASPYLLQFGEGQGEDWRAARYTGDWYGVFGEGLVFGQFSNLLGKSGAAFRAEAMRRIGGWDDTDNSKFEGWGTFLKVLSEGGKLGMVPTLGFFYRVRGDSMFRTYNNFPGWLRVARNTTILPRWEALCLQSVMRDYYDERGRITIGSSSEVVPTLVNRVSGYTLLSVLWLKMTNQVRKRLGIQLRYQ